MTEDDIYRTSTQYRLWSYTEESLASLRSTTNELAVIRVKDAIQRVHLAKKEELEKQGEGSHNGLERGDVDCLTVEEEQKLVSFYCVKAMELADFCEFPTNVKVFDLSARPYIRCSGLTGKKGNGSSIPQALLSLKFPHDLPSEADDAFSTLPSD